MDVAVDATLHVRDGDADRPFDVADFATGRTGAASEITLAALLEELSGKVEPADLAALASAAKQDAARAVLETIAGALAGTLTVAGSVSTGGLTDAQLRAAPVPVSGSVTVANPTANPETGLAKDATLSARYAGGKQAAVATVTASGDTTLVTPAAGKAVRLFWVSAINDPDESTTPLIRVLLGAQEVYRGYAVSHWEVFTGAVNQPLTINLSGPASVAVTAHYTEVTP